jgi:phage tail sheath protein FI
MPVSPTYPGVYIEEVASGVRTITGVPTSITAFVGVSGRGPISDPVFINSYADYERAFGRLGADNPMAYSVFQYYQNGGSQAIIVRIAATDADPSTITLDNGVAFAATSSGTWGNQLRARVDYADTSGTDYNLTVRDMATGEQEKYVKVSLDPNSNRRLDRMLESSALIASTGVTNARPSAHPDPPLGADPLNPGGGITNTYTQGTAGDVGTAIGDADILGSEAAKTGIYQLLKTDIFNILVFPPLNPLGINCLRTFPISAASSGARARCAAPTPLADEWKYVPGPPHALFIEESLYRGTQWVVFEPNDEPLWAQIRLNVGAFMQNLFRQGAFQGKTPREAYFVKCDKETTTQNDINLGIVNIVVGFAPLKPAEFVVIKIQQMAGQIEV